MRQDWCRRLETLAGAEAKCGLQQALSDDLRLLVVLEPEAAPKIVEYRDVGSEARLQGADLVGKSRHLRGIAGHHRDNLLQAEAEREHGTHSLSEAETRLPGERMVLLVRMRAGGPGRRRNEGVVAMHVGTQRMRHYPCVQRLSRQPVREVAAMPDIDLKPHVDGSLDDRVHLAVLVDEAAGMPRERVGEDIAGAQQADRALDDGVGIHPVCALRRQRPQLTEMNIDRQIGFTADLARHLHDCRTPAGKAADLGMRLYTLDEIA